MDKLIAKHVGWYREGVKIFRVDGHPVAGDDYLVQELSHPSRRIAFVKTGKGIRYGETYILPFNDSIDRLVEFAFSEGMVKKHYNHGFEK